MNPIKNVLLKAWRQYGEYDPTIWIYYYCMNEKKKKKNNVKIETCLHSSKKAIKHLWGKMSWWFDFYNTVGDKDKVHLYFPDPWYYKNIDARLNDWKVCIAVDDKSFYDYYFTDVNRPKTLLKICGGIILDEKSRAISLNDAVNICRSAGGVIVKPSFDSVGGHGITFWKDGCERDIESILKGSDNVVIQALIEQHPVLSAIHPDSVNTIRIMTMTTENGVKDISSILRMGIGKSKVDNVSSGGIAIGIDNNGVLKGKAFSGNGTCYTKHPDGADLVGVVIPAYHECMDICKATAPRFARFSRLTSWDFAVGSDGKPILIEANLHFGELDFHQMCNGPIFGNEASTMDMIKKYLK